MYNPVLIDKISEEQNRRIQEQQALARAYNQLEQKPKKSVDNRHEANHLFEWLFLLFEKRQV